MSGVQDLSDDQLMFLLQQEPQQQPQADVGALAAAAAARHGVPVDLVNRVIRQESGGRVDALSPKGAQGLMQLMPATARELGVDPSDPAQNIDGGVRYLKQQLDRFKDPRLALAAYNAGPGAVAKYGGVPPYAETQDYVSRIAPETPETPDAPVSGSAPAPLDTVSDQQLRALLADIDPETFGSKASPLDFTNGLTDKEYLGVLSRAGIYTPEPGERMVKVGERMLPIGLATKLGGYEDNSSNGERQLVVTGGKQGELDRALLQLSIDRALEQEANWRKSLLEQGKEHYDSFSPAFKAASALTGGAADTLTLGTFDEIAGGLGSLVNDLTPAENAALVRQMRGVDFQDRPVLSVVGQLGGGLLLPGGEFLGGAKSLPGAIARGATLGAGYGAAYGAGSAEGDLGDRANGAVKGGLTGAAFGGAFPVAGRVVGDVARPAVQSLGTLAERIGIPTGIPARMTMEDRRVADTLSRSIGRDGSTLEQVLAAQSAGPTMPFERAGENLVGLAEIAAQAPGRARSMAVEALTGRTAAAGDRTGEAIGTALGGRGDFLQTLDDALAARSTAAKEGMAEVGEHLVKLDENSITALRSDLASSAIEDAARNALASADPEIRNAGAALRGLRGKLLDSPNGTTIRVRDAQDISRALNEAATSAYRTGDGGRGKALSGLAKAIRGNASTPERGGFAEYGAWLAKYGDDTENIAALEAGRDVFSPKLERSAEALKRQFADLSDAGKDNFRKGVGEALLAQVRSRKGGVGAMRDLLRSKEFADRVRIAFPDDASFSGFMDFAKREVDMQGRANQILANSATARRQLAAQDVEEPMSAAEFIADNATLDLGALAGRGAKGILKKLPRKDRGVLTNSKMNEGLGEALFGNGDKLDRLLRELEQERTLKRLVRSRGQGAGGKLAPGATVLTTDRTGPGQRTN